MLTGKGTVLFFAKLNRNVPFLECDTYLSKSHFPLLSQCPLFNMTCGKREASRRLQADVIHPVRRLGHNHHGRRVRSDRGQQLSGPRAPGVQPTPGRPQGSHVLREVRLAVSRPRVSGVPAGPSRHADGVPAGGPS